MDSVNIVEFRTTWNNEAFLRNRSGLSAAQRLVRKSVTIEQGRLCRQLKSTEGQLAIELQTVERDRQMLNAYHQSAALSQNLKQRLQDLQEKMRTYDVQTRHVLNEEKEYWKEFEKMILRRMHVGKPMAHPSKRSDNTQPPAANGTYILHTDKNDENKPPARGDSSEKEDISPVKIPKVRKKKATRT